MKFGIIGIGHAFNKQYKALKSIKNISLYICDKNIERLHDINEKYKFTDYKKLLDCDYILISTGPESHLEIAKYFLEKNKKVILEKPMVINLDELNVLEKYKNNIYSSLHFKYGPEIQEYKYNFNNKLPKKIEVFISDKYVQNNHIINSALGLCGSYLDETINPLSALCELYGYNIKYISSNLIHYDGDVYDYCSTSKFTISNIDVNVNVYWNDKINDKYIDLFFDNEIIRLDSMHQQIQKIDNFNNVEILYENHEDRMTNHYTGVFDHIFEANIDESFILHKEVLKGAKN